MLLCIDMGNTMTKFGVFDSNKLKFSYSVATDIKKTIDEYQLSFESFLKAKKLLGKIDKCIFSSVVPPLNQVISEMIYRLTKVKLTLLKPGVKTGLTIKLDQPKEVGGDLIADAVAATAKYGSPVFVVDLGTATKILAIDKNGSFLGGVVTPGINVSLKSLNSSTSLIPSISLEKPSNHIGRNTKDSVNSGVYYGNIHMIRGIISDFENEIGYSAKVILTGGCSHSFIEDFPDYIYDENLSLDGLQIIYCRNEAKICTK